MNAKQTVVHLYHPRLHRDKKDKLLIQTALDGFPVNHAKQTKFSSSYVVRFQDRQWGYWREVSVVKKVGQCKRSSG